MLRLSVGETVELFNGRGGVGRGVIEAIRKREADVQIASVTHEPEPLPRFHLATAVPKGERFDWLVEKATELGVSRLIPLQTERGAVDPRDSKLDRLRQTIIAACKQCGRNRLMELSSPIGFAKFVQSISSELLVAHPTGQPLAEWSASTRSANSPQEWTACIGPEGGFTDEEVALAQRHGAQFASLGENLLRIETAGIALAAWAMVQFLGHKPPG